MSNVELLSVAPSAACNGEADHHFLLGYHLHKTSAILLW